VARVDLPWQPAGLGVVSKSGFLFFASLAIASVHTMKTTTPAPPPVDEIRRIVRAVCESRGVARADLFGSMARGEGGTGSDVDLLVEFLPGSNAGLFEMGALKEDLEEKLGCRVDLVSRRALERSRNPFRRAAILAHSVPLYAH
jgi:predicted nucleotidyltransferase